MDDYKYVSNFLYYIFTFSLPDNFPFLTLFSMFPIILLD